MLNVKLSNNLKLKRCPHCSVDNPNLSVKAEFETQDHAGANRRVWLVYVCAGCGGVVSACAQNRDFFIDAYFPSNRVINDDIPDRPRTFLNQALESLHAPAGAVMLAASAIDAMLKDKCYVDGSLYTRIEAAASDHLITQDMAIWAHEVRLEANDQRHADEDASLPSLDDAKKVIDFATALAEIMFVLPSRVQRGITVAQTEDA